MQNRIHSIEDLIAFRPDLKEHILLKDLITAKKNSCQNNIPPKFDPDMGLSPYYANLIDATNNNCPILLQSLPSPKETSDEIYQSMDPLAEEENMPVNGLTHRYPDRVLWYTTHNCAVFCRYCMRKRKVSNPISAPAKSVLNKVFHYIQTHKKIKEVILSGGDPLTLSDDALRSIITGIKKITHIKSIRIHTRIPVTMPMRITSQLGRIFADSYPITVVTHFNHPVEITDQATRSIRLLRMNGVHVLNQSVLLKNINDSVHIMEDLLIELLSNGVLPYYLHRCDEIPGNSHFQVPIKKGLEILKKIRGNNPGISIPRYMIDLPGGGGKIPVEVDYQIPGEIINIKAGIRILEFKNYEQKIFQIQEFLE